MVDPHGPIQVVDRNQRFFRRAPGPREPRPGRLEPAPTGGPDADDPSFAVGGRDPDTCAKSRRLQLGLTQAANNTDAEDIQPAVHEVEQMGVR
jgi:hypothetical protein